MITKCQLLIPNLAIIVEFDYQPTQEQLEIMQAITHDSEWQELGGKYICTLEERLAELAQQADGSN